MDGRRFDALTKRLVTASVSRRRLVRGLGGAGLTTLGLASSGHAVATARAASQAGTPSAASVQTALDALDPDTRESWTRALWLPSLQADQLPSDVRTRLTDPKNSNHAFGERMAARLHELLATDLSFVPSDQDRFAALLPYATSLSPHQAYVMAALLGPLRAVDYPPIPSRVNLQFPQAHAMQLWTQVGWYYLVGSCTGASGREYGVALIFFRYALLPPALAAHFGLSDADNQVVELQLAITQAGGRHYQAAPIVVAGTSGLLKFATAGLGARVGKNVIQAAASNQLFPLHVRARGQDDGLSTPVDLAVDLTFTTGRDVLLQGDNGCALCCDGIGTRYYSIPGLRLDPAASTLTLKGEQVALTEGTFWFDHQCGILGGITRSPVLRAAANLQPPVPLGWDWFEAQFTANRQITGFAIHANALRAFYFQTGPTPPGTMRVPFGGKYLDAAGESHDLTGTVTVDAWIKSETSPNPTLYPPTQTWYPNHWVFQFGPEIPADIRTFSMVPTVDHGQTSFFANGEQYSEAAVVLHDAAGAEVGRGFAEGVSYADTVRAQLALLGMPTSDSTVAKFRAATPSTSLRLLSGAYVAAHAGELKQLLSTCQGL